MMNEGVIALGSNIDPEENISTAIDQISRSFQLVKHSELIYTKPLGYTNQPDFLNGAALIETPTDAKGIKKVLKDIEQKMGRQRIGLKDGPRKIDLDLVLFNGQIFDDDVLERDFLKRSIKEVLPDLELPL